MTRLVAPAALVAAVVFAVLAPPAAAQETKSASEIRKTFAQEREKADKASKEKELAALVAYAKGKVADKEDALLAAQRLAAELEKWAEAKTIGDQFLAEFASSEDAPQVKLANANAIAQSGGAVAEAVKLFDEVAAGAGDNKQLVFNARMMATDALLAAGDAAGALATLDKLGKELAGIQQVEQIVAGRRAEISAIGTEPKPFAVKDEKGAPLSLADYKGKVVLVDFWATWCGPCREELPNVIETYAKLHDKGFEIIGISLDEDEKEFREVIASEKMVWRHFFDGKGWGNEVAQLYGIQSIPATYLLDRDGKVARIGLRGDALGRAVEKLLAK